MEKKSKGIISKLIFGALIFGEIASIFVLMKMYVYMESQAIGPSNGKPYLVSALGMGILISFTIYSYKAIIKQRNLYSELEKCLLEELSKGNIETSDKQEENRNSYKRDILSMMVDNARRIKSYFSISIAQEIASYIISIFCAVSGVIIIFYSIFVALNNEEIEVAVISIVSGAITEAVAGMVLLIHNKSAEQLNYYYKALHENEKFLSAINLADKLDDTEKKEMYMEIIKAQIRSNEENKETENRG